MRLLSAASGLLFTAPPLSTAAKGSFCGPISKMGKRRPRRPSLPLVRGESKVCLAAQPDHRDARETVDPLPSPVRGSPQRRAGQLAPRDLIHYLGSALCPRSPSGGRSSLPRWLPPRKRVHPGVARPRSGRRPTRPCPPASSPTQRGPVPAPPPPPPVLLVTGRAEARVASGQASPGPRCRDSSKRWRRRWWPNLGSTWEPAGNPPPKVRRVFPPPSGDHEPERPLQFLPQAGMLDLRLARIPYLATGSCRECGNCRHHQGPGPCRNSGALMGAQPLHNRFVSSGSVSWAR